jgi:alkylated DNA repair dioxygenase AlkB
LNYYRHGNDSVAWHSDDEKELGNDPVIASLSLGATRRFELKHRHMAVAKSACELNHGSLLVMGRGIQQHWQHQVPKQPVIHEPRINLTFRYIVS